MGTITVTRINNGVLQTVKLDFNQFCEKAKSTLSKEHYGFRDDDGQMVYLLCDDKGCLNDPATQLVRNAGHTNDRVYGDVYLFRCTFDNGYHFEGYNSTDWRDAKSTLIYAMCCQSIKKEV